MNETLVGARWFDPMGPEEECSFAERRGTEGGA